MKLRNLMMMTGLAVIVAMPAMAETTHKMHNKMHHKVSETTVMGDGMKMKPDAQHVEKAPADMKMQTESAKASGDMVDPNSGDPSAAPR